MKSIFVGAIKIYRYLLSPWIGNSCRFYPSCSHYGEEAIQHHGVFKGSLLTIWRILRCNPWSAGGIDPVPGTEHLRNDICLTQHNQKESPLVRGEQSNEF